MAWYDKYYDEKGYEREGVYLPACSWFGPIPDEEAEKIYKEMTRLEAAGTFDDLFKGECKDHRELPTKEKVLDSIKPDMKLYKSTFKRIYGYELTYPGYAEKALTELEKAGCSKAREHYARIVGEYEQKHEEDMKEVASWFRKKCDEEFESVKKKGSEIVWKKQQEMNQIKLDLHQKSDKELLILLQKLSAESEL